MRFGTFVLLAAVTLALTPSRSSQAQTYTLNFDTGFNGNPLTNGTLLNTAYVIPGVTFNATAQVLLSGGGVTSQPNFASGDSTTHGALEIDFTTPADFVSDLNVTNSSYTLTAFDAANHVLGTSSTSTFGTATTITAIGQISRVQFTTSSQYGIDDLTFRITPASVPEPGSIALLTGMGVTSTVFVRRRKQTAHKAA